MMALVAASEKVRGQSESCLKELRDVLMLLPKLVNQSFLERNTLEGDSPVD